MSKILRIDMSSLSIKSQEVPEAYLGLGGRGLTSAIISKDISGSQEPSNRHY